MIITAGSKIFDGQGQTYTLTEMLGNGGFGSVYKANRDNDHAVFAVKVFSSDFATEKDLLSFQKELQQSLLVKSEYVIDYLYAHDGSSYAELPPYIIMEYADGGSLADILDQRRAGNNPFASREAVDMFMQLCTGMKAVNKTLVHRDIKPENILVCNRKLKISDFGLSKIATDTTKTLTFKGYGSARYVAPEAWDNHHATVQMDIYSMGIVFYEIATLGYPYSIPVNADYSAYRNAHCYQAPNSTPLKNSNLSAGVVSVVIRMMDKPTQTRYSDWDSIINAIAQGNNLSPDDAINQAVERALSERNEYDISQQAAKLSAEKTAEEKRNNNLLIYSQLENTILLPIKEFINQYNSKYQGSAKFKLNEAKDINQNKTFFISINTPIGEDIIIETEVIYQENFKRSGKDVFDRAYTRPYTPQCKGKDILAWSCVSDSSGIGFNLLLLKNQDSMYGDWFIMNNRNSGLSRNQRIEPFGFSIRELPKEIDLITAMHIYYSDVVPFSCEFVFDYLGKHVSYDR